MIAVASIAMHRPANSCVHCRGIFVIIENYVAIELFEGALQGPIFIRCMLCSIEHMLLGVVCV